jgi:hypothetical protein
MELATRRVHLAGCSATLGDPFLCQVARNLTDPFDGFLRAKRYILMDRDAHLSFAFRRILNEAGAEPVRLPARGPNLNSQLERFHLSLKSECLERMIFFGETSFRRALTSYLHHFNRERNHQGLGNTIIESAQEVGHARGHIERRETLCASRQERWCSLQYFHLTPYGGSSVRDHTIDRNFSRVPIQDGIISTGTLGGG